MILHFKKRVSSPHPPLSIFSKTAIVALLIISGYWIALASFVPHNAGLYSAVAVVVGITALIATGIRWTPVLGTVFCSLSLYAFIFQSTFPLYHLAHPKDAYGAGSPWLAYLFFTAIVVLFWCMGVTVVAGIAAVIQNYSQCVRHTPRWYGFALTGLLGVLVGAILLGSFAPPPQVSASAAVTNGETTVHLGISNFSQTSVTLTKGSKVLLIDDGTFEHNISTGRWVNGQPQDEQQTTEPHVYHVKLNAAGQKLEIGPFTNAGIYHLYCSIHAGMTLTITVH